LPYGTKRYLKHSPYKLNIYEYDFERLYSHTPVAKIEQKTHFKQFCIKTTAVKYKTT